MTVLIRLPKIQSEQHRADCQPSQDEKAFNKENSFFFIFAYEPHYVENPLNKKIKKNNFKNFLRTKLKWGHRGTTFN